MKDLKLSVYQGRIWVMGIIAGVMMTSPLWVSTVAHGQQASPNPLLTQEEFDKLRQEVTILKDARQSFEDGIGKLVEKEVTQQAQAISGKVEERIAALELASVPVGTIAPFAGNRAAVPAGWLVCDGKSYQTTDYRKLATVLGNIWGAGPDAQQFVVPDLRGQFLRGLDEGKGKDSEGQLRSVGSVQEDTFKNHTHDVTDLGHNHSVADPGHNHDVERGFLSALGPGGYGQGGSPRGSDAHDHPGQKTVTRSRTGISINSSESRISIRLTGSVETRPKNAAIYYIIRAK